MSASFYGEEETDAVDDLILKLIDRHAEEMFSQVVKDLAKNEGITETLKACDQMVWVGAMNNIRQRARELVNSELIYR